MATDSGCLSEIIPGNDTFVLLIYGNSYEFLKTVIKNKQTQQRRHYKRILLKLTGIFYFIFIRTDKCKEFNDREYFSESKRMFERFDKKGKK